MIEFLKIQWGWRAKNGLTAEKMRSLVPKYITLEQFEEITGEAYEL